MKEQISISIRYIDKDLYERLSKLAAEKGLKTNKKKDIIEFILNDYVALQEINDLENPYLMENLKGIIDARCDLTEKNLGNRLMSLYSENAINLGVLNRIILDYFNKFSDSEETHIILNKFRQEAVDDLRQSYKPISYAKLIKESDGDEE